MSEQINNIFTKISGNYDTMNHILSLGVDKDWRREAARKTIELNNSKTPKILDIATGTGDLAFEVYEKFSKEGIEPEILGIDFNPEMLKLANQKATGNLKNIKFKQGDALKLQYPASSFDLVISGFALRNFDDLKVFSKEMFRVLKKGGSFVLLDMAAPDDKIEKVLFNIYSFVILSIGALVDYDSYLWLVSSINRFNKKELKQILKSTGFDQVQEERLVSGVAYILTGKKN